MKFRHLWLYLLLSGVATNINCTAQNSNEPIVIRAQDSTSVIDRGTLEDVVITSSAVRNRLNGNTVGAEKIDIGDLAKTPVIFGERDLMKSIQLLPGVKSEGDGQSGFQVRGGTSSQNLVLLDGAPVYNAGHLMGFFSTFNDDALTAATLYKGLMPAKLGGGVSSVFDISTRTGNASAHKFGVSIGLLAAKATAEGPIGSNSSSYMVTGRRSYLDLFLKATDDYKDTKLNFFDINAKINFRLRNNDNLSISYFKGQDNMGLRDLMEMKWGNTSLSTRWFHTITDNVFLSSTALYSNFNTNVGTEIFGNQYNMQGYVRQFSLNENLSFMFADAHNMNAGLQSGFVWVKSGEWDINFLHEKEKRRSWETNIWLQDDWQINEKWQLSAGLRANIFAVMGSGPYYELDDNGDIVNVLDYKSTDVVKAHINFEPRIGLSWRPNESQNVKIGYNRTVQNIHAIRNSTSSSMPFDRYTMTSNIVDPMTANQVSLGYARAFARRKYDISLEAYYKDVRNVYDYKDGKSFMSEIEIERLLLGGKGRAYGVEMGVHKNVGKLTGWLAYTLSWTENKIDGINGDKWYWASNDRRHDINIVGMYSLNDHWDFSATWVYNTGQALTAPSAKYELMGDTHYYFAERNGYRAPAYHRMDISATHTRWLSERVERKLSFGIYNLYSHKNPYLILFSNDDDKPSGSKTEQIALFGLVPSVSYSIKF